MSAAPQAGLPYEGWAPFYDELVGAAGFAHVWPAFRRACRRFAIRFASAADIGCGTGLFLAALARRAPQAVLVGVDRSAAMLRVAARRLAGQRVRLVQGDLRLVRLPRPADLLTCNFATLNYLRDGTELERTFRHFAAQITAGGYLVFDFLCAGGTETTHIIVQKITLPRMRARWHLLGQRGNARGRVVMRNCRRDATGWSCWQETHDQRWWPLRAVLRRLRAAGFVPLAVEPLGGVPPARGGRWVQIVARRA